ncbi:DUF302 domain-containing protein [Paraburkholderia sediminicola]|uniref:DUF302 domain-containing protein n=1 Tax=Paraburkholderia sediminicola TaxID=458836 RepID=UPI0038BD2D0B
MKTSETQRQIVRVTIDADVTFESFVKSFQERLGQFDQAAVAALAGQPREAAAAIQGMEGDQGLMIFFTLDHGRALTMVGQSRKVIRFILGNPLVAIQMTRHDVRAGQYVPLTLIAYEEEENRVRIEYDQPSSLLEVCENADVDQIARELDTKLLLVVEHAINDASQVAGTK